MRAIVMRELGSPEVLKLEEVGVPTPGEGQVLVKVEAAGVNYVDTMRRKGTLPTPVSLPHFPGIEVCGVITALGAGVSGLKEGQRIMARIPGGGYAEYALVPVEAAIPVPENMSPQEAAAFPVNWLTAYHALKTMGCLRSGEVVLIHAAGGGVGTAAVQIAKLMGGKVFATASSDEKLARVKALGADEVINYEREDFVEVVGAKTGGRGVDVILESVGGEVFERSMKCLAPRGRLIVYGRASGKSGTVSGDDILFGNRVVAGLQLAILTQDHELQRQAVDEMLGWVKEGKVRVVVGEIHPLENAAEAHRRMESRQTYGKIVLIP